MCLSPLLHVSRPRHDVVFHADPRYRQPERLYKDVGALTAFPTEVADQTSQLPGQCEKCANA